MRRGLNPIQAIVTRPSLQPESPREPTQPRIVEPPWSSSSLKLDNLFVMNKKLLLSSWALLLIGLAWVVQLRTAHKANRLTVPATPTQNDAQSHFDKFQQILKPLLTQKCVKCHGEEETNADIDFRSIGSAEQLIAQPELLQQILDAIDTGSMPPDGEDPLSQGQRNESVSLLNTLLRQASLATVPTTPLLRRLNRFQYNNTLRDLFQLDRDVFSLPEKLMTRYDNYLSRLATSTNPSMPATVNVASHALSPLPGLAHVQPFPKDLRAEHGYDNQADQLNLSPLLLDAFLRMSVSIVESPDFNPDSVGIWQTFFAAPPGAENLNTDDRNDEIKERLARFLRLAFRGPVDEQIVQRYTRYTVAKMDQGLPFTQAMKKVASAILSSPLFLYRTTSTNPEEQQFELASRLSYFLWGSCPDDQLLSLAQNGQLSDPQILNQTIDRMLVNPKIERFLDSFPTQWMQLENVLAATPDPSIDKYFQLDPQAPASLQMVLQPLLLFDTVFVEDRPITDLIAPNFSYQSDFLKAWYTSQLAPAPVNVPEIEAENQRLEQQRQTLQGKITSAKEKLAELLAPVRAQVLEALTQQNIQTPPADLRPFAAWDFNGNLKDLIGDLDLTANGKIKFQDGMVVLDQAYLLSSPLPIDFREKSFEIWFELHDLDQHGGGLMGLVHQDHPFDTIVLGERKNRHWISGSNGFVRTEDFQDSVEENQTHKLLHLVMVYADDGTTTLYRNGQPYGKPFQANPATFKGDLTRVIFGLRHLPAADGRFLSVNIDQARLYNRALTPAQVNIAAQGPNPLISPAELVAYLTPQQVVQNQALEADILENQEALQKVPANIDVPQRQQQALQQFEDNLRKQLRSREFQRIANTDPRYGGIITNAAVLSMTSGPKRTHPVARGVWVIEVIFNDPPLPPPNDVPPLDEESADKDLTIREQFAAHRENPSCAGCHTKLDPLGFALENFDITGRWRDQYANGRQVDPSGTLLRKIDFQDVRQFKDSLVEQKRYFAKAFTQHLLRFSLARELALQDNLSVNAILEQTQADQFRLQSLIHAVVTSDAFLE